MKRLFVVFVLLSSIACVTQKKVAVDPDTEVWQSLFDGKSLDGWHVKIRGQELDNNYKNTFRVVDGKIVVNYDEYDDFNAQYGHLFYKDSFSYYKLVTEYRFVGEQARGGEDWAYRNSGVMVHGQPAQSMGLNQDFPISIEVQLLGAFDDGRPRTTCNLCTPGTNVWYDGKFDTRHCINAVTPALPENEWVRAEIEVYGDSLIRHWINGKVAMEYTKPTIGNGNVKDYIPAYKIDGQPLTSGSISVQSESHPVEFRKIELLNLKGCMNRSAKNFKSYYLKDDPGSCSF